MVILDVCLTKYIFSSPKIMFGDSNPSYDKNILEYLGKVHQNFEVENPIILMILNQRVIQV